jgi:hypothetical protein
VEPGAEDGDRAAVAVEGGVVHELIVEGDMDGLPDLEIVVGFEDLLPAVGQGAVASEDAQATGGEEVLVDFGDAVEGSSETVSLGRHQNSPLTLTPRVAVRSITGSVPHNSLFCGLRINRSMDQGKAKEIMRLCGTDPVTPVLTPRVMQAYRTLTQADGFGFSVQTSVGKTWIAKHFQLGHGLGRAN